MHVTFGLSLDARQGASPQNSFNAPVVGRLGLLSLLETYLGLSAPESSAAQRVASYLGHLQQVDDSKRFFSKSLKADSIGTAARLLSWRDEWRIGGWDGTAPETAPRRVCELALVEQSAAKDLAPGEGERLSAVATALKSGSPTPIQSVELVEPPDALPWAWRQVLSLLPNVSVQALQALGAGQLRIVQEAALDATSTGFMGAALPPTTDGSVQLVTALSRQTAEHWLSAHNAANPADRLVVAEELGDSLDATLAATGGANCGFESPNPLRPALQAVGLALELCWEPLDIARLVDFLTHPVGPLNRAARARLAETVVEQPGVGGDAWKAVKKDIAAQEGGAALVDEIDFWLEGNRWTRTDGAPIEVLLSRVDRLRDVFRRRLPGDSAQSSVFLPAYQQCSAVFDGLTELFRQGMPKLLPREVEQLIANSTPSGAVNPASAAQVGGMRSARRTSACIDAADEVVWWMPASPVLPAPLDWSDCEVQALAKLGVELRDPAKELKVLAVHWLRPLLAARRRFILVLPPPGAEEHPLRQLLLRLAPDLESRVLNLDDGVNGAFHGTLAEPLTHVSFPDVPRNIQLPSPLPLPTGPQSFTSLTELFNSPALYALKRVARLRPTAVLAAEEDNRLLGTLAHKALELLFANAEALGWSSEQARAWFRANAGQLLQTEGALLLMQGAGVSQQRFLMTCERAITTLLGHFRAAGVKQVRTEVEFKGVLGNIPLTGKVDLAIELQDGRTVALDIKWRDEKRYAVLLHEGRHLQLALYSTLVEQATGQAPAAVGFFILDTGALLISTPDVLPTAQVRRPPDGSSITEVLQKARATWDWRAGQWAAGQLEVVPVDPPREYGGPEGTLPVEGPKRWDSDHLVLLGGWEQ